MHGGNCIRLSTRYERRGFCTIMQNGGKKAISRYLPVILIMVLIIAAAPALAQNNRKATEALINGDFETAFQESHPLAKQGNGLAQTTLGILYIRGLGIEKDFKKAIYWFKKAALNKDIARKAQARSEAMLGVIYQEGKGVAKDYHKAVKWYKKASKKGDPSAQGILSTMYATGKGVKKNFVKALKWSTISAELGYSQAETVRDMLTENMSPQRVSQGKSMANEWMKKNKGVSSGH